MELDALRLAVILGCEDVIIAAVNVEFWNQWIHQLGTPLYQMQLSCDGVELIG